MKNIITVKDRDHLNALIEEKIKFHSNKFDLNHLDVSKVTDISYMFYSSEFNGDLSDWLPYKLENKEGMFDNCTAPTPYWYTAEDTKKAIESYKLKNKLEDKLSDIKKSVKKSKI